MIRKLVRQMLTAQIFSALTVSLCLLIDNIMIGRFLKEEGLAAYSLANPILLIIGGLGTLLAVDLSTGLTGVSIPVSLLSVLTAAIGGVPGVTLMLALNLFF